MFVLPISLILICHCCSHQYSCPLPHLVWSEKGFGGGFTLFWTSTNETRCIRTLATRNACRESWSGQQSDQYVFWRPCISMLKFMMHLPISHMLLVRAPPLGYDISSCAKLMYIMSCGKFKDLQSLFFVGQLISGRPTSSMRLGQFGIYCSWVGWEVYRQSQTYAVLYAIEIKEYNLVL